MTERENSVACVLLLSLLLLLFLILKTFVLEKILTNEQEVFILSTPQTVNKKCLKIIISTYKEEYKPIN